MHGEWGIQLCHVLLIHALSRFSVANCSSLFSCKHYSCAPRQSFKIPASLLSIMVLSVWWSELQGTEGGHAIWDSQFNAIGLSSSAQLSRGGLTSPGDTAKNFASSMSPWLGSLAKKTVKMNAAVLSTAFSNPREERDWLFFSLPFFFSTNC